MPLLYTVVPTPSPSPTVSPDSVTPGIVGFVTILLLTVAVVLLVTDMLRRIRRVRYRGEIDDRRRAAERDQE